MEEARVVLGAIAQRCKPQEVTAKKNATEHLQKAPHSPPAAPARKSGCTSDKRGHEGRCCHGQRQQDTQEGCADQNGNVPALRSVVV